MTKAAGKLYDEQVTGGGFSLSAEDYRAMVAVILRKHETGEKLTEEEARFERTFMPLSRGQATVADDATRAKRRRMPMNTKKAARKLYGNDFGDSPTDVEGGIAFWDIIEEAGNGEEEADLSETAFVEEARRRGLSVSRKDIDAARRGDVDHVMKALRLK